MIAQTYSNSSGGGGVAVALVFALAVFVLVVAGLWRVFTKAGEEGWKAIIPIYNWIILLKIVGREWWWILLWLIPIVNVVIAIIVYNDLSKSFGKGVGFTVGLFFLNAIFIPILGFGSATYIGPGGRSLAMPPMPG
jgi:hypothetical protein